MGENIDFFLKNLSSPPSSSPFSPLYEIILFK